MFIFALCVSFSVRCLLIFSIESFILFFQTYNSSSFYQEHLTIAHIYHKYSVPAHLLWVYCTFLFLCKGTEFICSEIYQSLPTQLLEYGVIPRRFSLFKIIKNTYPYFLLVDSHGITLIFSLFEICTLYLHVFVCLNMIRITNRSCIFLK